MQLVMDCKSATMFLQKPQKKRARVMITTRRSARRLVAAHTRISPVRAQIPRLFVNLLLLLPQSLALADLESLRSDMLGLEQARLTYAGRMSRVAKFVIQVPPPTCFTAILHALSTIETTRNVRP